MYRERSALRRRAVSISGGCGPSSGQRCLGNVPRLGLQTGNVRFHRSVQGERGDLGQGFTAELNILSVCVRIAVFVILCVARKQYVGGAVKDIGAFRIRHVRVLCGQGVVRVAKGGHLAVIGAVILRRCRSGASRVTVIGEGDGASIATQEVAHGCRSAALVGAVIGQACRRAPRDGDGLGQDIAREGLLGDGTVNGITSRGAVLSALRKHQGVQTHRLNGVACGSNPSVISGKITAPNGACSAFHFHVHFAGVRSRRDGDVVDRRVIVDLIRMVLQFGIAIETGQFLVHVERHHEGGTCGEAGDRTRGSHARQVNGGIRCIVSIVSGSVQVGSVDGITHNAGIAFRTHKGVVGNVAAVRAVGHREGHPILTGVLNTVAGSGGGKHVIVIGMLAFASTETKDLYRVCRHR